MNSLLCDAFNCKYVYLYNICNIKKEGFFKLDIPQTVLIKLISFDFYLGIRYTTAICSFNDLSNQEGDKTICAFVIYFDKQIHYS